MSSPEGRNAAAFAPQADDVFARIAGRYDRLCDVFSLFAHRLWKERMAARMASHMASMPEAMILDVASGTGDIPFRLLRRGGGSSQTPARILVSDLCPEMLALARRKLARPEVAPAAGLVEFALLDAHNLAPVPSGSIDIYSISFAMKICDRERVVAEAFRVLKPSGLFLCLEAGHIPVGWVQAAYLAYMEWCIPAMGRLATRDPSSYAYLLRGIRDFPAQPDFAHALEAQGFCDVRWENLTFGIVALHGAVKPAEATAV